MPIAPASRTPAIAARKAEMQNTSSRVKLVDAPLAASPVGLSERARSSRPSRLRPTAMTKTVTTTASARHR